LDVDLLIKEIQTEEEEEANTEEKLRDELKYAAKLDHYHTLLKAVSENSSNAFGIELTTAAAKREYKSSFQPSSLEGLIAGAVDVWRNQKSSTLKGVTERVILSP
jgi:hypothetical protein